jgi:hypothetical protein
MRLVQVREPPEFEAICLYCERPIAPGGKVADLDGEPFKAYYHSRCLFAVEDSEINRDQADLESHEKYKE